MDRRTVDRRYDQRMSQKQVEIDVAVLQEKYMEQRECLKDIRTKHLPDIQSRLNSIDRKIAYAAGGLAVLQYLPTILKVLGFLK